MSGVRDTSAEAYHAICDSGDVGKQQKRVYEYIYRHGPCTGNEVAKGLYSHHNSGPRARITELKEAGLLKEVGRVDDPITGRRAIQWDVTSEMPKKIETKTCKQKLEEAEAKNRLLERRIAYLLGLANDLASFREGSTHWEDAKRKLNTVNAKIKEANQ